MIVILEWLTDDISDDDEREIVSFGVARLKVALIALVLIIVTGIFLHETFRCVLVIAILLPLRQNAGGYHMKSSRICAVISYVVLLFSMIAIKYFEITHRLAFVLLIFSAIVIILISPIGSENHPLDDTERKVYGRRTRIICCFDSALFMILLFLDASYFYKPILMAELLVAIALIIGRIMESGKE